MNRILWAVILTFVIVILILQLERLRRRTEEQLRRVLYMEKNPKLYLQLLENRHLRLLFSEASLQHMRLQAYLVQEQDAACEQLFRQLDGRHLPRGERIEYAAEKLQYYTQRKQTEPARQALAEIHALIKDGASEKDLAIREDADMICRIYIEKDASAIPVLQEQLKTQGNYMRAVSLYRMARLYHAGGNDPQAQDCLEKALPLSKGGTYEKLIAQSLGNLSLLDE